MSGSTCVDNNTSELTSDAQKQPIVQPIDDLLRVLANHLIDRLLEEHENTVLQP